jgi:hypothetical protein
MLFFGKTRVSAVPFFLAAGVDFVLISGIFDMSRTPVSGKQKFIFFPIAFRIACLTIDPARFFFFEESGKDAFSSGAARKFISMARTFSPANIEGLFCFGTTAFATFTARLRIHRQTKAQAKYEEEKEDFRNWSIHC